MKRTFLGKLLYLFIPEESGGTVGRVFEPGPWQGRYKMPSVSLKALVWIVFSVIAALMIGQLN